MTSLLEMNVIKYSAYRLAMKLRSIQRRLQLDLLDIEVAHRGFEEHGLTAERHEVGDGLGSFGLNFFCTWPL